MVVYPEHGSAFPAQLEGLLTLLSDDERPTFILDTSDSPKTVYRNASLLSLIAHESSLKCSFDVWVAAIPTDVAQKASATVIGHFGGREWYSKRLGYDHLTVVYCACTWTDRDGVSKESNGESKASKVVGKRQARHGQACPDRNYQGENITDWFFDWIHYPLDLPDPWISFLRAYDWEKTALGPIEAWPLDLCRLAIYALSAPDPRVLFWGDSLLMLFNEPAAPFLGDKYLDCLGNPIESVFGHATFEQDLHYLRRTLEHGRAWKEKNLEYELNRFGFPEETYFDLHLSPFPGDDGYLVGSIIEFTESFSIFQERRRNVTSALLSSMKLAQDLHTFWPSILDSVVVDPKFVLYAALYTRLVQINDSPSEHVYQLHGQAGNVEILLSKHLDISASATPMSLAAALHDASESQKTSTLHTKDGSLPDELAITINDRAKVHTACVLPITDTTSGSPGKHPSAFLVLGMNPRLRFKEEDYRAITYMREAISSSFSVVALPEGLRRGEDLKMLNEDLARRLEKSATQVKKSEENFARMATNAPFGMYMFTPDGIPRFVNEAWLTLCGFSTKEQLEKEAQSGCFWRSMIPIEDHEDMAKAFADALSSKTPTRHEHRVIISQTQGSKEGQQYRWVEANSFPELDDDGSIVATRGWLVDVTDRKLAETLLSQRLEDALETKRASERFIDMVSHEIRNPLSAILQLADGMLFSAAESIEATIDAAKTIISCAAHQKKIVDDVLVISKLDSNLLVLAPDQCSPPDLIRRALKMHEVELAQAKIEASLHIEESYKDLAVQSVLLDESRILQIVINLVGNAIKFTRGSQTRRITISISATQSMPSGSEFDIKFAALRLGRPAILRAKSSSIETTAQDNIVHLQFAVQDTGRGLTQEEIEKLFQRFSQGSPKTYKKYGGSGLGLYISKELTELQGGQIGVSSGGLGKGSTFAFYVKTQRCEPPALINVTEASIAIEEVSSTQHTGEINNVITKTTKAAKTDTSAHSLHVLVVEDNAINQKVMAQQLRRAGCTVHIANHGLDALNFLATTHYQGGGTPLSIILMDCEMPVMDGLTCTRRVRELEGVGEVKHHIPIIAVTANARNQQIAAALEAGVDEVVTKPFRIPELLPRMQALVQNNSSAD